MTVSLSQALLTGVYRSGTEYVSLLLSGHPELSSTMYHVNSLRFIEQSASTLTVPENLTCALEETRARLAERYDFELDITAVRNQVSDGGQISRGRLYDAIMSVLWLKDRKKHWIEKCQLLWREIPEFIETLPNGRAILVIRDPRSVLASFKKYTYAPNPLYLGAVFNCYDAMAAALGYLKDLPTGRILVVRYEDVSKEPRRWMEEMFSFLQLDPGLASYDPAVWTDFSKNPWVANSSFDDGQSRFDIEASINRWRDHLSPLEIAFAEYVCGQQMREFDYRPEGPELDWPEILKIILQDKIVTEYLREFMNTGKGIEAFPTDPLSHINWEENKIN